MHIVTTYFHFLKKNQETLEDKPLTMMVSVLLYMDIEKNKPAPPHTHTEPDGSGHFRYIFCTIKWIKSSFPTMYVVPKWFRQQ